MIKDYIAGINLLDTIKILDIHEELKTEIRALYSYKGRIIFLGNGGSFQGHMAHDFLKVGGIDTLTPDSPSLLTCLMNDLPKVEVYSFWLKTVWKPDDILIAVSSSGESENIINAINWVKINTCSKVATITGFNKNNRIAQMGDYNVHFPTNSYGVHECLAQIFLHSILDDIVKE